MMNSDSTSLAARTIGTVANRGELRHRDSGIECRGVRSVIVVDPNEKIVEVTVERVSRMFATDWADTWDRQASPRFALPWWMRVPLPDGSDIKLRAAIPDDCGYHRREALVAE